MGYIQGDMDCRGFFIVRQGPPQWVESDWDEIARCWRFYGVSAGDNEVQARGIAESYETHCDGVWTTFYCYGLCLDPEYWPRRENQLWAMMQLRGLDWQDIAEAVGWDHTFKFSMIGFREKAVVVSWICHCQDVSDELPMFDWYSFEPDKACEIERERFGQWAIDAKV